MSEPATITVPLTRLLDIGGGQSLSSVVLREPRMREYAEFGEPLIFVPDVNGNDVPIENDDVIKKYLERLVVAPPIPALLFNMHLTDAIRVKEALLTFFLHCRDEALRPPSTSSSSGSDTSAPQNGTN